jgi:hypothetical protein
MDRCGDVPALHIGRAARIRRADFDALVEVSVVGEPQPTSPSIWDGEFRRRRCRAQSREGPGQQSRVVPRRRGREGRVGASQVSPSTSTPSLQPARGCRHRRAHPSVSASRCRTPPYSATRSLRRRSATRSGRFGETECDSLRVGRPRDYRRAGQLLAVLLPPVARPAGSERRPLLRGDLVEAAGCAGDDADQAAVLLHEGLVRTMIDRADRFARCPTRLDGQSGARERKSPARMR